MTLKKRQKLISFIAAVMTVSIAMSVAIVPSAFAAASGKPELSLIPNIDSYEVNAEPLEAQDHSLLLYYSFENDSSGPKTITDDSGNGYNGQVLNNDGYPRLITVENATNGKVLNIPGGEWGGGAAVKIPEAVRAGITGDYTVSMWVKADGSYMWGSNPQRFFDFGIGTTNSIFVRYNIQTGDLRFQDRGKPGLTGGDDPNGYISATNKSFVDRWGLLTVTYTAADNAATVYVNGEPVMKGNQFPRSLGDIPPLTDNNYGMYLGRTQWQNADNPDFRGLMDEVRIYNRAISDDEIEELYLTTGPEEVVQTKDLTLRYMAGGIEIGRETVEVPRSGSFTYRQSPAIAYNGKLYTAGTVVIADTAAVSGEYAVNMTDTPFWTNDLSVNAYIDDNANLPRTAKLCYNGGETEVSLSYDGSFSSDKAGVYTVSGKHNGVTVDVTVKVYERRLSSSGNTIGRASKVIVRFKDAYGAEIADPYEAIVRTGTSYTVTDKLLSSYPHIANAVIPDTVIATEPVHEIYVTGKKLTGVFGTLSGSLGEGALNANARVINTGETDTEALLIIARYNGQKLTEAKIEKAKLPANSVKVLDLSSDMPYDRETGEDVMGFLWTSDIRPLDKALIASDLPEPEKYSPEITELIPEYEDVKGDVLAANNYWQMNNSYDQRSFWDIAAYHTGNMETYFTFGGEKYLQYSKDWANARKWMGNVNTWTAKDSWTWNYPFWDSDSGAEVLHGDWQICFQTYLDLYTLDPDNSDISRVEEVMGYQITKSNDDFWWWADALYMVPPVMTKLYRLTGNEKYLDKMYEYYRFSAELMYDGDLGIPNEGETYTTSAESYKKDGAAASDPDNYANLFFRDAGYVYPLSPNPGHEGEKNFWARGNGWVFAGLAKILSDIPKDYKHRDFFETIYNEMAASIIACQMQDDKGRGFWTQSMLQNYPLGGENNWGYETSGTAFFTYGLFWGLNNGMLDEETYLEPALRGWKYLSEIALQDGGKVGYCQQIGSNATQATPWYVEQSFGYGAFLLAGCEVSRWADGENDK